jgi:hypothetical protein
MLGEELRERGAHGAMTEPRRLPDYEDAAHQLHLLSGQVSQEQLVRSHKT